MKNRVLQDKSSAFGVRIVKMKNYLQNIHHEFEISKQVVRSGTSIGANIAEAFAAQSDADFIAKLYISRKEANETRNWLDTLHKTNYLNDREFNSIFPQCEELIRIINCTIKKKKKSMEKK